jgi:hypothetical protein
MTRVGADIHVAGFGLVLDGPMQRLEFPRAQIDGLKGSSKGVQYAVHEVVLDKMITHLDRMHWAAGAGSAGRVTLTTPELALAIERVELPRGIAISSSAEGGIEIRAPQAIFHDVTIALPMLGALGGTRAAEAATTALQKAADVPLRQEKLRWLDSLQGEISTTVKVVLDLPVLGTRTLDQDLKIPIKDGNLDYRALDDSLDWLEGSFLDLGVKNDRFVLSWRVPVFGRPREIVSFQLDLEGRTTAVFDRVPLRAFADYRLPDSGEPKPKKDKAKGRELVRSLTLSDIKLDLSMTAPRSVEIGEGILQLGGDDEPGIVGLALGGSLVHPPGPGQLTGRVGLLDITAKDLALGPVGLTVDRLHVGAIDPIELRFEGFTPAGLTAHIHRVSATNLALRLS